MQIRPSKNKQKNVSRPDFYKKKKARGRIFLLFDISSMVIFSRSELAK